MASPVLSLQNVTKAYQSEAGRQVPALDGVSLTVDEGEFVSLTGPTGCGKTTLLNIVAGLDTPDSGEVVLGPDLRPGGNMPCVFQHYTLFPWRSLLENVAFGLEMCGTPKSERESIPPKLLEQVGLQGFENAYPHELSGGMRQRAAIAQALAINPRMLLMDEPFGAVDDTTRLELQAVLARLWNDQRITILFVTHNIDEAITLGDRVIVFSPHPARLAADIPIELPRPRDPNGPGFMECFAKVRSALKHSS